MLILPSSVISRTAGHVVKLSATREQIDLIVDMLDDFLKEDDGADEVRDCRYAGRPVRGVPP